MYKKMYLIFVYILIYSKLIKIRRSQLVLLLNYISERTNSLVKSDLLKILLQLFDY